MLLLLPSLLLAVCPAAARCMLLLPDNRLWVGCDDGRVFIFDGSTEAQLGVVKAAAGAINAMALLGSTSRGSSSSGTMTGSSLSSGEGSSAVQQVWVASDRVVGVHDAASGALLFSLPPEADGFVKGLWAWSWGAWLLSSGGLRQLAARAAWEALEQQVGRGVAAWQALCCGRVQFWAIEQQRHITVRCRVARMEWLLWLASMAGKNLLWVGLQGVIILGCRPSECVLCTATAAARRPWCPSSCLPRVMS